MVFVDVTPRRPVQFPIARIFASVARWLADARTERAKRMALQSLLFAPEHRLRDIGIRREEVLQAMERRDGRFN
jgi:uncharacterized protein YjiS (DUF1127 family)